MAQPKSTPKRTQGALEQLSSQIAHDIRSPIATLKIALQDDHLLPEPTQLLLKQTLSRLLEIADQLSPPPAKWSQPTEDGHPLWFTPQIRILKHEQVIILDDDPGIHSLWKSRIKNNPLVHFSTAQEIMTWYRGRLGDINNCVFLIDLELGPGESGLDLIDKLGLGRQAILVTSRAEETQVRTRAMKLGCTVLTKIDATTIKLVHD